MVFEYSLVQLGPKMMFVCSLVLFSLKLILVYSFVLLGGLKMVFEYSLVLFGGLKMVFEYSLVLHGDLKMVFEYSFVLLGLKMVFCVQSSTVQSEIDICIQSCLAWWSENGV